MKTNPNYIFVDDGYPESCDYDTNYICWNPETPGSFESALAEAKTIVNQSGIHLAGVAA
jgi:hypothetical protein